MRSAAASAAVLPVSLKAGRDITDEELKRVVNLVAACGTGGCCAASRLWVLRRLRSVRPGGN